MNQIEQLRAAVEAAVTNAPVTVFMACIIVGLLWFAWYVVRGHE